MTVCRSDCGNLAQFTAPDTFERVGAVGEGYALCSDVRAHGYDVGSYHTGFGAPTISQPNGANTFPLTITRRTADGVFDLTQTFTGDSVEEDVTVTMTVKNVSGSPVPGVKLSRYFDGDVDGTLFDDRYGRTADAVWGWNEATGHGLMLAAQTLARAHTTGAEQFALWDPISGGGGSAQSCAGGSSASATPADYVGRVNYELGTIAAGASVTVKFQYRRF
jgi:hypothetical protein